MECVSNILASSHDWKMWGLERDRGKFVTSAHPPLTPYWPQGNFSNFIIPSWRGTHRKDAKDGTTVVLQLQLEVQGEAPSLPQLVKTPSFDHSNGDERGGRMIEVGW